ncbi:MAG: peptidylprolyl isomerase [Bacteroidia bacterium]
MKNVLLIAASAIVLTSISFAQEATKTKNSMTKENIVLISTDYGNMKVKLYNETPQHRDNFLKLVKENFYDSLLFHRVIKDFMIQGGDPDSRNAAANKQLGGGTLGYTVPAEFDTKYIHKKGALAAARTNNPEKASSASQFYLVQGKTFTDEELNRIEQQNGIKYTPEQRNIYKTTGGTPHLDMGYTVYGEVIEGLDVIDKIAAVQTMPGDRPAKDVKMKITLMK